MTNNLGFVPFDLVEMMAKVKANNEKIEELSKENVVLSSAILTQVNLRNIANAPNLDPNIRAALASLVDGVIPKAPESNSVSRNLNRFDGVDTPSHPTYPPSVQRKRIQVPEKPLGMSASKNPKDPEKKPTKRKLSEGEKVLVGYRHYAIIEYAKKHNNIIHIPDFIKENRGKYGYNDKFCRAGIFSIKKDLLDKGIFELVPGEISTMKLINPNISPINRPHRNAA